MAEHDRILQTEHGADSGHVVGHLFESAAVDWGAAGTALSPQVDEDDLRTVAQSAQSWPQVALVEPWAPVQYDHGLAFGQPAALHAQLRSVDVDIQLGSVHRCEHDVLLRSSRRLPADLGTHLPDASAAPASVSTTRKQQHESVGQPLTQGP